MTDRNIGSEPNREYNPRIMTNEERILRLENAFSTLVELARTQSERKNEYKRRTQERVQTKMEMAQAQREIAETQKETAESLRQISETQKKTKANLSALSIIMSDLRNIQLKTERTLSSLIEKVDQHIAENDE